MGYVVSDCKDTKLLKAIHNSPPVEGPARAVVSDCKDTKLLQKIGCASANEQARLHSAFAIFESYSHYGGACVLAGMRGTRIPKTANEQACLHSAFAIFESYSHYGGACVLAGMRGPRIPKTANGQARLRSAFAIFESYVYSHNCNIANVNSVINMPNCYSACCLR